MIPLSFLHYRISTHTLTWSVTRAKGQLVISSINFNSHAHVERDTELHAAGIDIKNFNSHAHVERDNCSVLRYRKGTYFNSHAHVERDAGSGALCCQIAISTHTLTWSVTYTEYVTDKVLPISTHTLTWSVTSYTN